ncbi:hypothetical protein ACQ86F_08085 [Streptomyces venezuelae ATCC 10712]
MLAHGAAARDWTYLARALVDDLEIGRLLTRPGPGEPADWFGGWTGTRPTPPWTSSAPPASCPGPTSTVAWRT